MTQVLLAVGRVLAVIFEVGAALLVILLLVDLRQRVEGVLERLDVRALDVLKAITLLRTHARDCKCHICVCPCKVCYTVRLLGRKDS